MVIRHVTFGYLISW